MPSTAICPDLSIQAPHSHHILAKFIPQQKRGKIGLASLPAFLYKSLNIFFKVSFKLGHLVS